MGSYLIADIGAGTMDVLYYDEDSDLHFKAVVKSPVRTVAAAIDRVSGPLVVSGCEMGGGVVTQALVRQAQKTDVCMTRAAAATVHHNPARVTDRGIKLVTNQEAEQLGRQKNYTPIYLGDLQVARLRQIVESMGVAFDFEAVGFCAQDHGVPPPQVSHLDFRHQLFRRALERSPEPHRLLFARGEIPDCMNRLQAIAHTAVEIPAREIYVMDSGMAAILGASLDIMAQTKRRMAVLDVATSHTVGAALEDGNIAGFFEYHTKDITLARVETLLQDLCNGRLTHERILAEGGHGAYTRTAFGFKAAEIILATGPQRRLMKNSKLPIAFGAPLGDNMMTGALGVLEAIRRRKQLPPGHWV